MRETAVDALSKSELRGVPPKCWHASTVGGLVDKPMYLTIADLKKMEKVDVPAVLQCSGNSRWFYGVAYAKVSHPAGAQWKFGGVGNARWSGVRVRDVLKKAGVKAGAEFATNFGRAKRPKKCLLATNGRLCAIVAGELKSQWSPQQIAGWLKTEFPNDPNLQISHETVYRALFVQARGALESDRPKSKIALFLDIGKAWDQRKHKSSFATILSG